MRRLATLFTVACLAAAGAALPAGAQCRQALALALDVSGSVDALEYRLQVDGLATALDSADVRQALTQAPTSPVELLIFEWSGPSDHRLILPWTPITSEADIDAVAGLLRATERQPGSPGTALGQAMLRGAAYLDERPDCGRRTLDISGDGKSNLGPRPVDLRTQLAARGITINALVIGADAPALSDLRQVEIAELSSYFRETVILGPDAFIETALGYGDYAQAMARKLERELQTMVLSSID